MDQKKARILWILGIAACVAALVFCKLFYVQVLASEHYSDDSLNNRLQEVEITPNRGIIYDRKSEALAISVEKESVYITPSVIRDAKNRDQIVSDIVKTLHMKKSDINKIIDKSSNDFAWLKRHVEKEDAEKLRKMNYLGIGFTTEYKREYPNNSELSHVLGFSGIDNQGLAGAELQFNDVLAGNSGKLVIEYDKLGNAIPQSIREFIPPSQGKNVHLTVDSTIQYYVEGALKKAQEEQKAKQMTCIVMDIQTGEILAMANIPDFDPNNYSKFEKEDWSNIAISKLYEPGSPFKSFSTSMYLEEDIVEPDTQFYCNGYVMIDGHRFQDWKYPEGDGAETMAQALAASCNTVQAENVSKLGKKRFYNYLDGFGMTQKTGVELPAESSPLLIKQDDAVPLDLAAEAIGQGNAYTALQMITAFCSVVNGGHLMKPQIVSKITDNKGHVTAERKPQEVRRIISDETSRQMRAMLEGVVTDGLGKPAAVEGYRVGGKTGTAEIAEGGTYAKNDYILSFMGFAPVENPRIACLVTVNSPAKGGNSGTVAGSIFSSIVGNIMSYYQIPQTEAPKSEDKNIKEANKGQFVTVPKLTLPMDAEEVKKVMLQAGLQVQEMTGGTQVTSYLPVAGTKVAAGSTIELYNDNKEDEVVTLPAFEGKTIKEVDIILNGLGLKAHLTGSGLAYRQKPGAGSVVKRGDQVKVWFVGTNDLANIEEATQRLEKSEVPKDHTNKTTGASHQNSE